jgi:hypothetical protein
VEVGATVAADRQLERPGRRHPRRRPEAFDLARGGVGARGPGAEESDEREPGGDPSDGDGAAEHRRAG